MEAHPVKAEQPFKNTASFQSSNPESQTHSLIKVILLVRFQVATSSLLERSYLLLLQWLVQLSWNTASISVLVSAGIIFFLVLGTALCFGVRRKIMLITHWCFSCYWAVLTQSQGHLSFSWWQQGDWGVQAAEMGQSGDPKGCPIPCGIMLNSKRELVGMWGAAA